MMNTLHLLLAAASTLAIVTGGVIEGPLPEDAGDSGEVLQEPTYDPRFLAVFIETDDGKTITPTNYTADSDVEEVFKKVHNGTVDRVDNLIHNLNVTEKVKRIMKRLGGDDSEDADRFKNIIAKLEKSTLSQNAIKTIKNVLSKLETGEGFALMAH